MPRSRRSASCPHRSGWRATRNPAAPSLLLGLAVSLALGLAACSDERSSTRPPPGSDPVEELRPRPDPTQRPAPLPEAQRPDPSVRPAPPVPQRPTGPWPLADGLRFGPAEGLPGRVTGVGVDEAHNVYAIDGAAVYALPTGASRFTRTARGGQLDLGWPAHCVCGGAPGRVYVGFLAPEGSPEELSEADKLYGDVDRLALQPDGTLQLEHHHRLQNSNARWMDHTRSILDCVRVMSGPRRGDLYVGSNHGVTLIRGDESADHRHAVFPTASGSLAVGYVWGLNLDRHGNLLFAGHWKLAALPPAPDAIAGWLDHGVTPWLVDTWAENLGPIEDPDELVAIAGDVAAGRIFVGARAKGLSAMQRAPRRWWSVPGTPDAEITALELDPTDGRLWVGTGSRGLWRYDEASGAWEASALVPSDARVHDLLLHDGVTPRAVFAATDRGLFLLRPR